MKIKYIIFFFILLFLQCRTNYLVQIRRDLKKSSSIKFINKEEFEKSRNLMFSKLPSNVLKNDTIIFIEYFTDGMSVGYYCTIYQSSDKSVNGYVAKKSIKDKKVHVDSLMILNFPDKILTMIREGKLDEIKEKGNMTTITPAAALIINIGVKNEQKMKFDFTTLITQSF